MLILFYMIYVHDDDDELDIDGNLKYNQHMYSFYSPPYFL